METMPAAKYSDEFKTQVVREVIEKERTIASVAASYDLVAQTVGNWVARYKREHATDQDRKKASESAEIAKLKEAYSWGVGEYDSEDGCDGFWEGF